jgi:hypothetical protein
MLDPLDYKSLNLVSQETPVRKIAGPKQHRSRSLTPQGKEVLGEWKSKQLAR